MPYIRDFPRCTAMPRVRRVEVRFQIQLGRCGFKYQILWYLPTGAAMPVPNKATPRRALLVKYRFDRHLIWLSRRLLATVTARRAAARAWARASAGSAVFTRITTRSAFAHGTLFKMPSFDVYPNTSGLRRRASLAWSSGGHENTLFRIHHVVQHLRIYWLLHIEATKKC